MVAKQFLVAVEDSNIEYKFYEFAQYQCRSGTDVEIG
jgi:hypothetical protein